MSTTHNRKKFEKVQIKNMKIPIPSSLDAPNYLSDHYHKRKKIGHHFQVQDQPSLELDDSNESYIKQDLNVHTQLTKQNSNPQANKHESATRIVINYENEALAFSEQQKQEYMKQVRQVAPQQSQMWLDQIKRREQENAQGKTIYKTRSQQQRELLMSQFYSLKDKSYNNYKFSLRSKLAEQDQYHKKRGITLDKPSNLENCVYNILKNNFKTDEQSSDPSRTQNLSQFKVTSEFQKSQLIRTQYKKGFDKYQTDKYRLKEDKQIKQKKEQNMILETIIQGQNFKHVAKPNWTSPFQNYLTASKPQKILNQDFGQQHLKRVKNENQQTFPIIVDNSLQNQISDQNTFMVNKDVKQNTKYIKQLANQYFQKKDKDLIRVLKEYEFLNVLSQNYGKSIMVSNKCGPSLLQYAFSKLNQDDEYMQEDEELQEQQEQEDDDQDYEQAHVQDHQSQQQEVELDDEYQYVQDDIEKTSTNKQQLSTEQLKTKGIQPSVNSINNKFNVVQVDKNDQGILLIILKKNFNVLRNNNKELVDRILKALEIDPDNDLGLVSFNQFFLFQRLFIIKNAGLEQKIQFIIQFFQYGTQEIEIEYYECYEIIRLITQKIDNRNFKKVKQSYLDYIFDQFTKNNLIKKGQVRSL